MAAASSASAVPIRAFAIRLIALAGIFALAVLSEVRGSGSYSERELTALYALVLAGFLLSLAYGVARARGGFRNLHLFELAGDAVLISGLVYCSGGVRSLFGPLYIIWIVYAAITAGSRAIVFAWAVATICYVLINWGPVQGFLPAFEPGVVPDPDEVLSSVGVHALAFLAVAFLSRNLVAQIQAGRAELEELGEIHQRIVDNVASGLLTVNRQARITSFNAEAERITGYTSEEVLGWPLSLLFPTLDTQQGTEASIGALVRDSSEGGAHDPDRRRGRMQLVFENRQKQRLHLGMSVSVMRNREGAEDGAILIFQDLTQFVAMEEQLRRSERLSAVGQLAAGLAHEIRNPLASLSGAIELLSSYLPGEDSSSRRLAQIVQRETGRLNRLVSDFLTYARPGPGRSVAVSVRELMDEIAELLASAEDHSCTLDVDIDPEIRVSGNADQLRQVFWNLVINAVQAEPSDARVRVRARPGPAEEGGGTGSGGRETVLIEVSDRGEGIPEELIERVFEPFFTTKPKGTGLGLATVHRVVEAHGGQLSVRSERGEGTYVTVVLPRDLKRRNSGSDASLGESGWPES